MPPPPADRHCAWWAEAIAMGAGDASHQLGSARPRCTQDATCRNLQHQFGEPHDWDRPTSPNSRHCCALRAQLVAAGRCHSADDYVLAQYVRLNCEWERAPVESLGRCCRLPARTSLDLPSDQQSTYGRLVPLSEHFAMNVTCFLVSMPSGSVVELPGYGDVETNKGNLWERAIDPVGSQFP